MHRGLGPRDGTRSLGMQRDESMVAFAALLAMGGAALARVLVGRALPALLAAARLAGAALLAAMAARALLLVGLLVGVIRSVRMVRHCCLREVVSSAREALGKGRT